MGLEAVLPGPQNALYVCICMYVLILFYLFLFFFTGLYCFIFLYAWVPSLLMNEWMNEWIAGLVRSPKDNSVYRQSYRYMTVKVHVCTTIKRVQNPLRVLECKLEDVDATAWSLHRWTPGGNVSTRRSGVTSAGQRHASGCDASTKSGISGFSSGQDCWLATELEQWSLVFHKQLHGLTRPVGRSVVL